ncbi:hypothetical protein O181_058554 [Austropuccinia psidii MF-1]|uniref:Uncharacterized protein n=1 Tax=Austropuccinia psidii MF-1 TaxID=1389203 RepID=A0A9Q3ECN4_9BASI|nr:hypothetical protein [Austropuccinia psidii MF-1]
MAYIHGTATTMTVCIENSQHPLIIDSGAHFSIVARITRTTTFRTGKTSSCPPRQRNSRVHKGRCLPLGQLSKRQLNPIGKVTSDSTQSLLCLMMPTSKGFDWEQITRGYPLGELLNEFREGQFSTTLTSKQKLSLLKVLRKNRPEFAIDKEPLGKIRGHDIELYLDVERNHPPILRRPPYPESLETRKGIEKHIDELLDFDFIRKIGHNEVVKIITPFLIT